MAWSPDGASVASGSLDKTVKIWNIKTGKCDSTLSGHTGPVLSVCFDHTGKKLASGGGFRDKSVCLWSTESGAPIGSPLSGHSRYVTTVSYSCLFSNVWCVLTIEHLTVLLGVFPSVQTANRLLVEARTKPLRGSRHVSHNAWASAPHSKLTETAAAYFFFEYLYF